MYEYNVLSNYDFAKILIYAICIMVILWRIAVYLGERDANDDKQKKNILQKVVPFGVLCVFLSDFALLIYRLIYYPWAAKPQPSPASIVREMRYGADDFLLWGWANDSQLAILSSLAGTALWLFWTIYAFKYKPSNSVWWKRACKVLAYIIISVSILGFNIHSFGDLVWWTVVFIVVAVLIRVSSGRTKLQEKCTNLKTIDIQLPTDETVEKSHEENPECNERPTLKKYKKNNLDAVRSSDEVIGNNIPPLSVSQTEKIQKQTSCSIAAESSKPTHEIGKSQGKAISNDNKKWSLLCRILIILLFVAELVAIISLININKVINYKLEPVTDNIHTYVNEHFGLNALSKDEYERFVNKNRDLISKHNYDPIYINALYCNKLYIDIFGRNSFYRSIHDYGDKAPRQREVKLKKIAYAYLYPKWKYEYNKYIELLERESEDRKNATYILYSFIILGGLGIYLLSYRKIKSL